MALASAANNGLARPASAASIMQPARVQSKDMEKLRRREEREARATWSRVVEFCAANQVLTVLRVRSVRYRYWYVDRYVGTVRYLPTLLTYMYFRGTDIFITVRQDNVM